MKVVKIKPVATLVAQLPAGVEQEVIVNDEGTIFVPMLNLGDLLSSDGVVSSKSKTVNLAAESAKGDSAESEAASSELYTEDSLMDLEPDELREILREMKVDPSKTPGKNTHKKLRVLILENQGGDTSEASGEEEPTSKKKRSKVDDVEEEVVSADDLEVGDKVNVWWSNMEEWYTGEVTKVSKSGKVTVLYDEDKEEEVIDPEINTKIKRVE